MQKIIITTSWDDGSPSDLKLVKLLQRHEVPATFYVPIRRTSEKCLSRSQIREIARDFDIGGHTYSHVNLTKIPLRQAQKEIADCKAELQHIIGRELVAFCYPWGAYNDRIVDIVKNVGFKGARTVRSFRTQITSAYELGTTLHTHNHLVVHYVRQLMSANNWKLFRFLAQHKLLTRDWREIAVGSLNYVAQNGGIWHLWGHSWDIDRHNAWRKLDDVLRAIEETADTHNLSLINNSQLMLNARADEGLNLDCQRLHSKNTFGLFVQRGRLGSCVS